PTSTHFPYTTLFRSRDRRTTAAAGVGGSSGTLSAGAGALERHRNAPASCTLPPRAQPGLSTPGPIRRRGNAPDDRHHDVPRDEYAPLAGTERGALTNDCYCSRPGGTLIPASLDIRTSG